MMDAQQPTLVESVYSVTVLSAHSNQSDFSLNEAWILHLFRGMNCNVLSERSYDLRDKLYPDVSIISHCPEKASRAFFLRQ